MFTMLIEREVDVNCSKYFIKSILVYVRKPQLVNKKLSHSANIVTVRLNDGNCQNRFVEKILRNLSTYEHDEVIQRLSEHIDEADIDLNQIERSENGKFLIVNRLEPRDVKKFQSRIIGILVDIDSNSAEFFNINEVTDNLSPSKSFTLSCSSNKFNLQFDESDQSAKWLRYVLYEKIENWMKIGDSHSGSNPLRLDTHSLIDSDQFNTTYSQLKEKYGKPLEENWNESTDPKKFIYEDIAIASYLIVLWNQENIKNGVERKQSFVDLGCGNGLLVHILAGEGHRGYGIDLRRRKIWDILVADLREMTIVPSDEHLFADVDWIIGNHSDELSPWIPVISARSSFESNFFLLPCCAFHFSGVKYNKKGSKSQYLEFIDYLIEISNACGFAETRLDRMKIPSTKRTCIVGTCRSYGKENYDLAKLALQDFIDSENQSGQCGSNEKWSDSFTPRDKVEKVRNCIRIDKSLKELISRRIFDTLLSKDAIFNENFPNWNAGGVLTLPEAVTLVSSEELKQLKSECGGLQTLLRNKHQVFHVYGGKVRIRLPQPIGEMQPGRKPKKLKSSICYFHQNHSSGCPLSEPECPYIHAEIK